MIPLPPVPKRGTDSVETWADRLVVYLEQLRQIITQLQAEKKS